MPQRSQIQLLPQEIREELERRLIAQAFGGYQALSDWLAEQGYEISKTAIHNFGAKFQERVEALRLATRQAQEMRSVLGDDEVVVSEMALQLGQGLLFNLMLERGEELNPKEIAMITRALTDASRGSVAVKKYQQEVKNRLLVLEADAPKRNLDPETLRIVREEIYGLAA